MVIITEDQDGGDQDLADLCACTILAVTSSSKFSGATPNPNPSLAGYKFVPRDIPR